MIPPTRIELATHRAKRIRELRQALRYSRAKFAEKYAHFGVNTASLVSWESARWHGLTEEGAEKLLCAFKSEGLPVTMEWLMYGVGENPLAHWSFVPLSLKKMMPLAPLLTIEKLDTTSHNAPLTLDISFEEIIQNALRSYHQSHPDSIDARVNDDILTPWLKTGDYVAGKRYFGKEIENAVGHPAIVQTVSGELLIRLVRAGDEVGRYQLEPHTPGEETKSKNVELFFAAPIDWVYRKPK